MAKISYSLNEVNKQWKAQKTVMLGESKIGKTEFWNSPNTFYIKMEPGHGHLKHIGVECRDLEEFDGILKQLKLDISNGTAPIDTVIVDTGDRLVQAIDEDVVLWANNKYKNEVNSIGDAPEGTGWARRTTHIKTYLKELENLGVHTVLIFHTTVEERENEVGKKYKYTTINLGGKAGKAILGWADNIMHVKSVMVGETMVRKVILRGSQHIEAGSRTLKDMKEIKWSGNSVENYEAFRKLFDHEEKQINQAVQTKEVV